MKYLAQINIQNNGGTFRTQSDNLDDIRAWAKRLGKPGDKLLIVRNGTSESRTFDL